MVKIYDQGRHKASWADNITESKCCIKTFKRILSHDGICKISKFKFSLTLQSPWFIVHYIQEETKIQKVVNGIEIYPYKKKNQGVQAMALKTIWTIFGDI